MADTRSHEPADVDPRKAMAQRYLEKARAELAAKEAERPIHRRSEPESDTSVTLGHLRPRLSGSTYIHLLLLVPLVTLAGLAILWCYVLLNFDVLVGRVIALPTGILLYVAISYASAYYLGLIESTSRGETNPDESLRGDWRDWFWLVPSTVGMFAAAAGIGYLLSLPFPNARWEVIGITTLLLYPNMQLSCLETGSPLSPFSLPILSTLGTRSLMWVSLYGISFVGAVLLSTVAKSSWRDPPYFTVMVMGPLITIALLIYGLLLGTAARWLSLKGR
jgi:hypothetical protein